jgi:hypothetical protein
VTEVLITVLVASKRRPTIAAEPELELELLVPVVELLLELVLPVALELVLPVALELVLPVALELEPDPQSAELDPVPSPPQLGRNESKDLIWKGLLSKVSDITSTRRTYPSATTTTVGPLANAPSRAALTTTMDVASSARGNGME